MEIIKGKTKPKIVKVEIVKYTGNKIDIFNWLNRDGFSTAIFDDGNNLGIAEDWNGMYHYPKNGEWVVNYGKGRVNCYQSITELKRDFVF